MPKAKLSQIASTWLHEEDTSKERKESKGRSKVTKEQPKKKQTFSLKIETIKRLWGHRAKTGKTISETMDELVIKHIPKS